LLVFCRAFFLWDAEKAKEPASRCDGGELRKQTIRQMIRVHVSRYFLSLKGHLEVNEESGKMGEIQRNERGKYFDIRQILDHFLRHSYPLSTIHHILCC
jgi:hypothetical protein